MASLSSPEPSSDAAVSDVLGSILLVGLTVGMTVVLAVLLFTYDGPQAEPRARLAIAVLPGDGGWGTGDEVVRVQHVGGMALSDGTHVALRIGTAFTDVSGPALGAAFADGRLTIGETWQGTWTIGANDLVTVNVIADNGGAGALLASMTVVPAQVAP